MLKKNSVECFYSENSDSILQKRSTIILSGNKKEQALIWLNSACSLIALIYFNAALLI